MSDTDERSTPMELFKELDDEFHFELDVCATSENAKCARFFTKESKTFTTEWAPSVCFMNPPYSKIPRWLYKAREEANKGATVVCILPCDSSTNWFHDHLYDKQTKTWRPGTEVRFPDKRYKFGEYDQSAKFATIIAVMRKP